MKPFHPTFICTDSSKYHRNTQYIKPESTYNSGEESDKHTTTVISRPAGQLLFSSLHPFLNSLEALQSGTNPQCSTNCTEQEANANLYIYFPSLPAAPHSHSQQIQTLRGGGGSRAGKEQGSCWNMLAWDWQFKAIRPWCL